VVHEETGFLVGSEEELSQKLDLLLSSPGLRERFSEAAAEHSRRFDWDEVTRSWEKAFEAVVVEQDAAYSSKQSCTQVEPR